jgi:hypothetical protein
MSRLLAIDPGCEESAWVLYDTGAQLPLRWVKEPNAAVANRLGAFSDVFPQRCVIEMIASYGMAVGKEVFETCVWIGRFMECWADTTMPPELVYRREVKLHMCASVRAKDANIRQAIIDRYGPGKERAVGLKASPGPLYGFKADCWQALALAITAAETQGASVELMAA